MNINATPSTAATTPRPCSGYVLPSVLMRAHILARGDEPDARAWDWSVQGSPRVVAADIERISAAFDRILDAAREFATPDACLKASVSYGDSAAAVSVVFAEGPAAEETERCGRLHARMAPVRAVFAEHGGALNLGAGWMTAFLPLA